LSTILIKFSGMIAIESDPDSVLYPGCISCCLAF